MTLASAASLPPGKIYALPSVPPGDSLKRQNTDYRAQTTDKNSA